MPREITAYQCEFCRRRAYTKKTIIKHERICWRNETLRACPTCAKAFENDGDCPDSAIYPATVNCINWEA